ncbi:MAG: type 4a pilus biogenesis protein PilO [Acidobacteriota bacterium]
MQRHITSLIFVVAIISVIWYASNQLYFNAQAGEVTQLNARIAQLKIENDENERLKQNLEQLEQNLANAEQTYQKFKVFIPTEAALSDVLDWIADQAKARNLKLEYFRQINRTKRDESLTEVAIQVQVLGYYDAVIRFIGDFNRNERILLVNNVQIEQQQQQTAVTTVRATLNFSAYLNKDSFRTNIATGGN